MHLVGGAEGGRLLQLVRSGWLRCDRCGGRMDRSRGMRTMLSCKEKERERIKHKNKCRYIFSCKTAIRQEEVMSSSPLVVFLFTFSR